MANYTQNLNLYKIDMLNDGNKTFDIKTMLNDNWDKIDIKHKEQESKTTQNTNKTTLLSTVHKATGTTNLIVTTNANFTYTDRSIIKIEIPTTQTGDITINIDSQGFKAIHDVDGMRITSLEQGVFELFYDGDNDFFVQRPNGLAKKKEREYLRLISNQAAVLDVYDRTVGATEVFYDLLDGTNDFSKGKIDLFKTNINKAMPTGTSDLYSYIDNTGSFLEGLEYTIQDDINKEAVLCTNIEDVLESSNTTIDITTPIKTIDVTSSYASGCIDGRGYLYTVTHKGSQLRCYKSTDNGDTWVDLQFPIIAGYNQQYPHISIDSSDNLHVVWFGQDSSSPNHTQIKYSKYDGSSWSSWINISPISGRSQYYPFIAIDKNDNLHVVWFGYDFSNPHTQIKYSKYDGSSWSSWVNISPVNGNNQQYPHISIDSSDNLHVVWFGQDSSSPNHYQIKYSKYDGSSWSSWINILPISGHHQQHPHITIDNSNHLYVVWYGGDSSCSHTQIKYSKYDGSSWSSWVNIAPISGYYQYSPHIVVDNSNNLHVVWKGNDSTHANTQIKYSKYDGSSWSGWVNISTGNNPTFIRGINNFSSPTITYYNPTDKYIYIYGKYTTDKYTPHPRITTTTKEFKKGALIYRSNVKVDESNSLMTIGNWEDIVTVDHTIPKVVKSNVSTNNDVLADSKGNLYVIYRDILAGQQLKCYQSTDNGNAWVDLQFPTITGKQQYHPYMAIDSNDNLHVVWYGSDSSHSHTQIKYSKYNGTSWSSWQNISVVSEADQAYPQIAIDSNDDLHVVWRGADSTYSHHQIKYSKYNNGVWNGWINISPITRYSQQNQRIAIDSNDNLHVVWDGYDSSSSYQQIKYSKFNGSSWNGWINIASINGQHQQHPQIAIDSKDYIHVVWFGKDSTYSHHQIKYSMYNGSSWGGWINISPISGYHQIYPQIVIDSENTPHVTWQGQDSTHAHYQIKYSNGNSWGNWVNTTDDSNDQANSLFIENIKTFDEPPMIYRVNNNIMLYGKWDAVSDVPLLSSDVRYNIVPETPTNEIVSWVNCEKDDNFSVEGALSITNGGQESYSPMTKTVKPIDDDTKENEFVGVTSNKGTNATVKLTLTRKNTNIDKSVTKILGAIG